MVGESAAIGGRGHGEADIAEQVAIKRPAVRASL